jgi:acetyl esterase
VLIYPVTDLGAETPSYADFADGFMLTRETMRWFSTQYLNSGHQAVDWRASPLRVPSLAGLPPALIVTAGFDPLRDEGEAYARTLREAGVRVDAICYGGMIHGFVGMGRLIESGNRAVSHIGASLRQALQGRSPFSAQ